MKEFNYWMNFTKFFHFLFAWILNHLGILVKLGKVTFLVHLDTVVFFINIA